MKLYCVKDRKQTDNIPGSELYVMAKNGRLMLQAQCALCGIKKSKFVSAQKGMGVGQTINKNIGDKIPGFQTAQDMASALMAVTGGDKDLFKKYWSGDTANGAFNTKTGLFTKKFWTRPKKGCRMELKKINGKWHNTYSDDC